MPSNENDNNNSTSESDIRMALPVTPNPLTQTSQRVEPRLDYIPPIYTINGNNSQTNNTISPDMVTREMVHVYRFGKSVQYLSIIDAFFGFFHMLVSPFGLISFIIPLFGYKGATSYNKCLVDS